MSNVAKQARQSITISVTEEDILEGVANNCNACPVARAFKRAVPGATDVRVTTGIRWEHDSSKWSTIIPGSAMDFIARFDTGDPVTPFEFRLYLRNVHNRGAL